jgi:2-haloacid dehalogenase
MVKAFVFDAYGTLFDVYSVSQLCQDLFPGKGNKIGQDWRQKQLNYFFIRQLMGRYQPFHHITRDALKYALMLNEVTFGEEEVNQLMEAYLKLSPYPEVKEVMDNSKNMTLAIFSNGSNEMLKPLVENTSFADKIDVLISADEVKQYKPTPAAYNLALDKLNLKREDILFMSSNTWDIAGAKSFGFHTAWINRSNLEIDLLDQRPDKVYKDLHGILEWV